MERVIIRVVIPECTLEEAIEVKKAIDAVVSELGEATVELNTTPVRAR
ncbi:unnamed protein product [marine sediment metagenome]|uniref:Uncharacterized protein n=1 Tax=marine sediment metagenome TaxID=412755 RepID=X1RQG6_9ZZZZ